MEQEGLPNRRRPARHHNEEFKRSGGEHWRSSGATAFAVWHALVLATVALIRAAEAHAAPSAQVELRDTDRVLICAPHPDDEVLGCGAIIQKAVTLKIPCKIMFLTDGDDNELSFLVYRMHPVILPGGARGLGEVRHKEALAAAKVLGLRTNDLVFLGYPDFGTLKIWMSHWGDEPSYRSMLTRVTSVPYAHALRVGAPYKGESILQDVISVITNFRPTKVFVSHPADHHPDHRTLYLFTQTALWTLGWTEGVQVFPYLIHSPHWPVPKGAHISSAQVPPANLAEAIPWGTFPVGPWQASTKRKALQAHRTQFEYSGSALLSFVRANELFGDFPVIAADSQPQRVNPSTPDPSPPPHLNETEARYFTGIDWQHVSVSSDHLDLTFRLSRGLPELVEASIEVFGFKEGTPFEKMPKLRLVASSRHHKWHNQSSAIADTTGYSVTLGQNSIALRVPLAALGDPTRVLASGHTFREFMPLDWAEWRTIQIAPAHAP
jgi:LmbE family N-acetylglucosaminyl deacetylase